MRYDYIGEVVDGPRKGQTFNCVVPLIAVKVESNWHRYEWRNGSWYWTGKETTPGIYERQPPSL